MGSPRTIFKFLLVTTVLGIVLNFILETNISEMINYLINSPSLFFWLIAISFLGHLSGTIAWKLCLAKEHKKVSSTNLFLILLICENLSVFNPTNIIAGDSLKGVMLSNNTVSNKASVSSVLLSRLMIIISAIALMIFCMLYLFLSQAFDEATLYGAIILLTLDLFCSIILPNLLFHKNRYLAKTILRLKKSWLQKWIKLSVIKETLNINNELIYYDKNHKPLILSSFIFSSIHWICGALEFYIILLFFGTSIGIFDSVVIEMGVLCFKTLGSIIPGQIGIEEYGNMIMLNILGIVGNPIWLAVSVLRRSKQLFWLLVSIIVTFLLFRNFKMVHY